MRSLRALVRLVNRAVPALLMAASVVLLSAGILSFAPITGHDRADPTAAPGDPNFEPTATPTDGAALPTLTPSGPLPTGPPPSGPTPTESAGPRPSATPDPPALPTASPGRAPTATPTTSPNATQRPPPGPTSPPTGRGLATRIVIPSMSIDLPIVSGDLVVPGNRNFFPLCDVAQYLTARSQPGEKGTTYLYGHARSGMFLPLLEASRRNNGRSMIGSLVEVYTSNNTLHLYEIYLVKRHATDFSLADQLPSGGEQLILQTSEGPRGTIPKLQVAARPITTLAADPREANPTPRPRVCG